MTIIQLGDGDAAVRGACGALAEPHSSGTCEQRPALSNTCCCLATFSLGRQQLIRNERSGAHHAEPSARLPLSALPRVESSHPGVLRSDWPIVPTLRSYWPGIPALCSDWHGVPTLRGN